jgi:hypothetical protein
MHDEEAHSLHSGGQIYEDEMEGKYGRLRRKKLKSSVIVGRKT